MKGFLIGWLVGFSGLTLCNHYGWTSVGYYFTGCIQITVQHCINQIFDN